MIFTYKSKGSADDWTNDTIEAKDEKDAQAQLDIIYGITRDEDGKQTNPHVVQVVILEGEPA